MKRILYLGLFVVAIAFTGVASYQWGARTGHERGEQYAAERSAVELGLFLYALAKMLEFGSDEKLKVSIVDAMWYRIIDIDNFTRRDDAAKEDLVLANNTLPRLVEYFHLNPRTIGTLMEGDQVDLRMRDHVFVNDVERHPSTRGTER